MNNRFHLEERSKRNSTFNKSTRRVVKYRIMLYQVLGSYTYMPAMPYMAPQSTPWKLVMSTLVRL